MAPFTNCLWFDGNADEAADFYLSVFPNSKRTTGADYTDVGPGEKGSTMVVLFELNGQPFMALNGGPQYQFTPAISFMVSCEDQDEIDYYWDHLVDGGRPVQCGWLADRFGVSWQIVPKRMGEMLDGLDPEGTDRFMKAMLSMVKLDIAALEAAAKN